MTSDSETAMGDTITDAALVWARPGLTLEEMQGIGRVLGASLVRGSFVCLEGTMGAGKTTLVRAIAEGMGIYRPQRVTSPTYTLCAEHPGRIGLLHLDLFRLADQVGGIVRAGTSGGAISAGFEALGLAELEVDGHVIAVEWPEYWPGLPSDRLVIRLQPSDAERSRRDLQIEAHGANSSEVLRLMQATLAGLLA